MADFIKCNPATAGKNYYLGGADLRWVNQTQKIPGDGARYTRTSWQLFGGTTNPAILKFGPGFGQALNVTKDTYVKGPPPGHWCFFGGGLDSYTPTVISHASPGLTVTVFDRGAASKPLAFNPIFSQGTGGGSVRPSGGQLYPRKV